MLMNYSIYRSKRRAVSFGRQLLPSINPKQSSIDMMTQATAIKPAAAEKTCATCPNFNNFQEPTGRGWCNLFDHQARTHHIQTNDCVLNLATAREQQKQAEAIFSTEIIWVDDEGYPMGEDTPENAYDDPNFVTYPNEPF